MKRINFVALLICALLLYSSCSTTITRWGGGKYEVKDQTIKHDLKPNIFSEYGWTRPNIESKKIEFTNSESEIYWEGKKYVLKQIDSRNISLLNTENSDSAVNAEERMSNNDIYYNKSILKIITVYKQRWVSYTTYRSESVPVQRTRQVSYSEYNYATKSNQTRYRTEYYTAYEYRSVPRTDWRWETYTERDVEIPSYKYYSFMLDNSRLLVYKILKDSTYEYYIQNSAYLIGRDAEKLSYVSIDGNANGLYNDAEDQIMFNSWNPYSRGSSYRKPKISFLDNFWFTYNSLKEDFMLDIVSDEEKFNFIYENNVYHKNKQKGRIKFTDLPKKVNVTINGKPYKLKNNKKYKIQYGKFNINVIRDGYLDYGVSTIVNNTNKLSIVRYEPTIEAGKIVIENIFLDNFFVTVTNDEGYEKTQLNAKLLVVPKGTNKVKIYATGVTFEYTIDVAARKVIVLDFEEELKKLKEEKPEDEKMPLEEEERANEEE
jgi:hypothetical protein